MIVAEFHFDPNGDESHLDEVVYLGPFHGVMMCGHWLLAEVEHDDGHLIDNMFIVAEYDDVDGWMAFLPEDWRRFDGLRGTDTTGIVPLAKEMLTVSVYEHDGDGIQFNTILTPEQAGH